MKNNSMTNFAFASTHIDSVSANEAETFNIGNQAAVLDSDPYQFLDALEQKITRSPLRTNARVAFSLPLSLN